jgi:tetrahydromethanopterin S-methyltransferase subunit G
MIMEAMRESWTDERLDDFRGETARRFDEVDKRFDKIDARFDRIDKRLDDLTYAMVQLSTRMLQFGVGTIITLVIGFLAVILGQ